MTKATNSGECQVCGKQHKLPRGMLAKHGYTVEHHFFNGVCQGSGSLPFEQDKTLAETIGKSTRAAADRVEQQATEERADRANVWIHHYDSKLLGWGRGGYRWLCLPLAEVQLGYRVGYVVDGKTHENTAYRSDPAETHAVLNSRRADSTLQQAKAMRDYADWQEKRCATWRLRDLQQLAA